MAEPCPTCGKAWKRPAVCPRCGGKKSSQAKVCMGCLGPEYYFPATLNSNAARVKVIKEMRGEGQSWKKVGEAIGVSAPRAASVYRTHQRREEILAAYRARRKE